MFVVFGVPYLVISFYFYFIADSEDLELLSQRKEMNTLRVRL